MRTVQINYTLFGIAELEDEAVEKAYTDWLAKGQEYPYAAFSSNTLEAFCNLFRVVCTYYCYDSQTYRYRFHTKYEESTEELRVSACGHLSIIISITGYIIPKPIG